MESDNFWNDQNNLLTPSIKGIGEINDELFNFIQNNIKTNHSMSCGSYDKKKINQPSSLFHEDLDENNIEEIINI